MSPKPLHDPTNPKYSCCCCGCHVTTATKVICSIMILLCFVLIGFRMWWNPSISNILTAASILILKIFLYGAGIYAVIKEMPKWMILPIFASILSIIYIIVNTCYGLITLYLNGKPTMFPDNFDATPKIWVHAYKSGLKKNGGSEQILAELLITALIIVFFNAWFVFIFYRCHQYLVAKSKAQEIPIQMRPQN